MPSVAYLLSDLGGGTGHHLFSLLRQREATAWDARVLSEAQSTVRVDCPVPMEELPTTGWRRYPFAQATRFFQLKGRLADSPPDILHTYFFWSIIYGRMLKATGAVQRLVENREDLGFNWGRHEYALLRLTERFPDRVVCVSEAVRRHVMEVEGLGPAQVVVIRNGVDLPGPPDDQAALEIRSELGIPPDSPLVGMVANFNRRVKGAEYFVDALQYVAQEVHNVRFVLIGLGENRNELLRQAEMAGVAEQLLFTGFRADIDRVYEAMDVSVLTSLSEGLSMTLLESMRHGLPVVATDVGGNPELVEEGETGYLVPPRDSRAFATAVVRLLEDPGMRKRFGQAAREVVRERFALSTVARAYGELYAELLNPRTPAR